MIIEQMNGYRPIRVTKTEQGKSLASGVDFGDGTFKVEEQVTLTSYECLLLINAFGAGLPKEHCKKWKLTGGSVLEIYGAACGNAYDWSIRKGRTVYLRGSGNFGDLVKALSTP
jgi:hypothetical protein